MSEAFHLALHLDNSEVCLVSWIRVSEAWPLGFGCYDSLNCATGQAHS